MKLTEARDYLAGIIAGDFGWFGLAKADGTMERALCLYRRRKAAGGGGAVGGAEGYGVLPLTLLIRAGLNGSEADDLAQSVVDSLPDGPVNVAGAKAFISRRQRQPNALGTDKRGVYEFSADFDLYYERGIADGISG
ncbi:MAG: hypothetical protein LBK41_09080 [Clostridiales bacterium]|jgi:hypothetical protein|nr:hypothetical protein [Clostridiales bacterium]